MQEKSKDREFLIVKDLVYSIGEFTLGPVNISLERGGYLALFGPSGSGKSLFMELLSGIRRVDKGSVSINGIDYTALPARRRPVALLFQDYALFPHMTVFENIAFPLRMKGVSPDERVGKIDELSALLSIKHLLHRGTEGLSGGEKQRTALARAIAGDPELLLLDEPLSALDHELRADASELLKIIKESGRTVIHVTHNKEEIEGLATEIVHFNNKNHNYENY
ncbi:MAG: ATP-binding cassette domain-containing protein [Bacteroidales bacterium]